MQNFLRNFAYFIYANYQPEKLFWQFIKHFELENDIKMTPKRHSFLPALFFTCFCINQYYIFKQIWTKRTIRKLDSSHSGIQIKVRNQFIYPSSSPLDNKILYKLIKIYVKQFTWSYDCLYKLPPVFLFIFTSAVSWIMELLHMKENCKNIL